jgi:hypothetical protein
MSSEPPIVTAHLHGGPRDGQEWEMRYGAKATLEFLKWETVLRDKLDGDVYVLRGPWLGQIDAHYDYQEPEKLPKAA